MLFAVYDVPLQEGPKCRAVFTLLNHPVQSLQFSASGARLAVGFESGHVSTFFLCNSIIKTNSD